MGRIQQDTQWPGVRTWGIVPSKNLVLHFSKQTPKPSYLTVTITLWESKCCHPHFPDDRTGTQTGLRPHSQNKSKSSTNMGVPWHLWVLRMPPDSNQLAARHPQASISTTTLALQVLQWKPRTHKEKAYCFSYHFVSFSVTCKTELYLNALSPTWPQHRML